MNVLRYFRLFLVCLGAVITGAGYGAYQFQDLRELDMAETMAGICFGSSLFIWIFTHRYDRRTRILTGEEYLQSVRPPANSNARSKP